MEVHPRDKLAACLWFETGHLFHAQLAGEREDYSRFFILTPPTHPHTHTHTHTTHTLTNIQEGGGKGGGRREGRREKGGGGREEEEEAK